MSQHRRTTPFPRPIRRTLPLALFAAVLVFAACNDSAPTTAPRMNHGGLALRSNAAVTGADYSITPFNSQGSTSGSLAGVNEAGHAAGSEYGVLSAGQGFTDYLWTTANDARPVIACCGLAGAINRADEVVGWGGPFPQTVAYVWTPSGGIAYPPLLPANSVGGAFGVNDNGAVVGVSTPSDFDHGHAVLWMPTAAGATTFTATDLGTLPGDLYSAARAINNAGQIVGQSSNSSGETHAVLWQPTAPGSTTYTVIALGTLGGARGSAWAINSAGEIVGLTTNSTGTQEAFLWTADQSGVSGQMLDLGDGWARGISDNGIVVGNGNSGYDGWVWTQATGRTALPSLNDGSVVAVQGISPQGTAIAGLYRYPAYGTQYPAAWTHTGPLCVEPPSGIVGWWRGEGNAADALGHNAGTIGGGVSFVPGVVGSAFSFDGETGDVLIGTKRDLNIGAGDGLTLEAWVNAQGYTDGDPGPGPIFEYFDGLHLWQYDEPGYEPYSRFLANFHVWNIRGSAAAPGAFLNAWHHLAFTYSMVTGAATLYSDGRVVATDVGPSRSSDPSFTGNTDSELHLGRRMPGSYGSTGRTYNGYIDEPTIYNRVLTPDEIQGIYRAGSAGKCELPLTNRAPVANPGGPYPLAGSTAVEGIAVAFDGSRSSDPDGDALTYSWNFGDPSVNGGGTETNVTPSHKYPDNGTYTVTLTVTDSKGAVSAPETTTVVVANLNPTGTLITDTQVKEGTAIKLGFTSVNDAPGDYATLHYAFDCGDGAGYGTARTYADAGTPAATSCATTDGPSTRAVRATIFDKDGGSTEYVANPPVNVLNVAPQPTLSASALTLKTAQTLWVSGSFADPGTTDGPWNWWIDWNDGSQPSAGTVTAQTQAITAPHAYKVEGTYWVTLSIIDKDGATGVAKIYVTVSAGQNLTWTQMSVPIAATFRGIWGSSPKDVFAVGSKNSATGLVPAVVHFDGSAWSNMALPSTYANYGLFAVSGNSPRNVYTIASQGVSTDRIVRYNGSSWSDATSQVFYHLNALWVSGTGTAYAVGYGPQTSTGQFTPLVVHYDGRTWQIMSVPSGFGPLTAVWGTADNDVYATAQLFGVVHWNGSSWSATYFQGPNADYWFGGAWGSSSSDIFAVGWNNKGPARLYHDASGSWSAMGVPGTSDNLRAAWGSASNDVYALGSVDQSPGILHYNGTVWSQMTVPSSAGALLGIWGMSTTNVFVVGDGGTILHGTP
jgi:probable HAF family extracellular repeat protein